MSKSSWQPVLGSPFWVHRYTIIGTDHEVVQAWEPSEWGPRGGGHSTITSIETPEGKRWLGHVTSRALTPELAALTPMSEERYTKVRAYQAWLRQLEAEVIQEVTE